MFKCILFDIDGTILDTRRASLLAAQQAAEQGVQKHYTLEELEFTFGLTSEQAGRALGFSDPRAYIRLVDPIYSRLGARYNRIFPGMKETLDALRARRVPLGIVTAKTRWEYDHDFTRFGLKEYFPISITADDCPEQKPLPGPARRFVAQSGCAAGDILYVGDTEADRSCARGAGIAFAFAGWSGAELKEADYLLRRPADLLDYV